MVDWLTGWLHRKKITISSPDTDYQAAFTVNRSSGTDSGYTVYVGTACESDYDDIRFTEDDGTTLLDYWIESADSSTARIWVKFASSSDTSAYLYYGNSGASAVSSGTDTFLMYHGTKTSSYYASGSLTGALIYEAQVKMSSSYQIKFGVANSSIPNDDHTVIYWDGVWKFLYVSNDGTVSTKSESISTDPDTYYKIKIINTGSAVTGYIDTNQIGTGDITTNLPDESLGLVFQIVTGSGEINWGFVRKYSSSDPSISWGGDETTPSFTLNSHYTVKTINSNTLDTQYVVNDTTTYTVTLNSNYSVTVAWLTGWDYRKEITIADAVTDYQTKFTVSRDTGTDSGYTVYVGTNCAADFDDIRFTEDDGTTLLDYWIESVAGSPEVATIWVKLAASADTTAYLYYGGTETAVSSGTDTFPFFDDFPGSSLDTTTNWDLKSGSVTVSGGALSISSGKIHAKTAVSGPVILRSRAKWSDSTQWKCIGLVKSGASDAHLFHAKNTGTAMIARSNNNVGTQQESADVGDYCDNAYHTLELAAVAADSFKYYIPDGTLAASLTYNIGTSLKIHVEATTATLYVDWVLIRKYAATEPTISAWGTEEEYTVTTYTITLDSNYKVFGKRAIRLVGMEYDDMTLQFTLEFGAVEDYYLSQDAKYRGNVDQSNSLM